MQWLDNLVGWSTDSLVWYQMAIRAVLAFIVLVILVRAGNKRLFGKGTAFDTVVSIMIGSIMAQSVHSEGAFFRIYVGVAVLIAMHGIFSGLAARVDWFGPLVKGNRVRLVKNGVPDEGNLANSTITDQELESALRNNGDEPDLSLIKDAWLERDGSISIVTKSSDPEIVEIHVRDGVQTVRVELG